MCMDGVLDRQAGWNQCPFKFSEARTPNQSFVYSSTTPDILEFLEMT